MKSMEKSTPPHIAQIVYTSIAKFPLSDAQVHDLVMKARAKNKARNISGILFHDKGIFLQVLEGPEEAVAELWRTIIKDPRHISVHAILYRGTQERMYANVPLDFMNTFQRRRRARKNRISPVNTMRADPLVDMLGYCKSISKRSRPKFEQLEREELEHASHPTH